MAGGSAADIRGPWPKGDDSVFLFQSVNVNVSGAVTGQKWCEFTLPFACKCLYAEFVAKVYTDNDAGNDGLVTIQDDTGTPKKFVNAAPLGASYAAGSCVARSLPVDKSVVMNAGAKLQCLITTEASDVVTDGMVTLWLQPVS